MSFADRLIHTLTHVRVEYDDDLPDDRGQPTPLTPVETEVAGLVQPKNAREMLDFRSVGSEIADHVIFLAPMDLEASDAFTYGGDRYEITGIRRFEFGRTPHLEVDARKITGAPVTVSAS
jgi:hypothetical protein